MFNRLIIVLCLLGLVACNRGGQSDSLLIEDADYDFGLVADSVQVLRHQFKIENPGPDTCRILKIEKSCGCTKVRPSGLVIAPYSTVTLDVEVDLGTNYSFFERDINVYTDRQAEPYTIFVRAKRQLPKELVEHVFPVRISDALRANMPFLIIGNCPLGEVKTDFININNQSDKAVKYTARLIGAPKCVSLYYDDEIPASDVGRVIITTDLSKVHDQWGLRRYTLRLTAGRDSTDIPVEAIFAETLTVGKVNPRIMMPVYIYTIDTKKQTTAKFVVANAGDTTLVFKDLSPYDQPSGATVAIGRRALAPHTTDTIVVSVPAGYSEVVRVGISTNDPIEPLKEVRIICKPN